LDFGFWIFLVRHFRGKQMAVRLSQQFEQALVFAAQLHARQWRKGAQVPYVAHLLGVTALVLEDGGSEVEAIAALLHDAIEDQGGAPTGTRIREQFGEAVFTIVQDCTEPAKLPWQSWRDHKLMYLRQIEQASLSVHRVTLADKLHNGRSLLRNLRQYGADTWTFFSASREDILWLQKQQLRLFQQLRQGWMVEELATVTEIIVQSVANFQE
jgi:(p)ppGpp synthase/HD superfamily hydrolase